MMSKQTVPIAEFQLDAIGAGRRERLWLEIGPGPVGPTLIPALAVRGAVPGRTLLAVAGIHGNEYEGMEAIRAVASDLDPARMAGSFLAIIIANPYAYEGRSRSAPPIVDGLNLARIFPGDPEGTPSQRLADALLRLVERHVGLDDLLLDLHSGTSEVAFVPLAGFREIEGPARTPSEEAMRHMGIPRLWAIPDMSGPLNAETARRGIPSVGTETTGRTGCGAEDVATYVDLLWRLLAYLGICPDHPMPDRDDRPVRRTIDLTAPETGFLRVHCRLDDDVRSGDRLATVIDPFGDPIADLISPIDGTIWALRETPATRAGELAFMVAERV
jgi:predicted deacylase